MAFLLPTSSSAATATTRTLRPWWSRRAMPAMQVPVLARGVTDIELYRELDQSHLHLKEAQSHMRKFEIKLKELELEKERRRKMAAAAAAALESGSPAAAVEGDGRRTRARARTETASEPVQVPKYIERKQGQMLR